MVGPEIAGIKALSSKNLVPVGGAAALAAAGIGANKKDRSGKLLPIATIEHGYMGMRMRFGRPKKEGWLARTLGREGDFYGIVGDGIRFTPTHSIQKFSVQEKHNDLEGIITDITGEQRQIKTSVWWTIKQDQESIYKALFSNENGELIDSVINFCATGLRHVIEDNDIDKYRNDAGFDGLMKEACDRDLGNYGLKLVRARLVIADRTLGQMMLESARVSAKHNAIQLGIVATAASDPAAATGNGQHGADGGMHVVA